MEVAAWAELWLMLLVVRQVVSFTVSGEKGPITVRRSSNVTLNCYVRGSDYDGLDHTIKWAKVVEGKHHAISVNTILNKNLSDHKYQIIAIRDLPTYFLDLQLKIAELSLEDNGTYLCEVLSVGGHSTVGDHLLDLIVGEQVRTLEMLYVRDKNTSSSYDEEIKIELNNPTDITCQASGGNPPPKLKVYLGQEEITNRFVQRRMSVTYQGTQPWSQKFVYNTQITCPSCELGQSDNRKLLQCESTVSEFENIVTTSKPLSVQFKPKIDCPDKFLAAKGSDNFVMKCTIMANPMTDQISWAIGHGEQMDGNTMTAKYRTTTDSVDTCVIAASLTIFRISDRNFRTRYKLTVSNAFGDASHLMTLSPGGQPDRQKAGRTKSGRSNDNNREPSTEKPYVRASGQATFFYNTRGAASVMQCTRATTLPAALLALLYCLSHTLY